MTDGDRMTVTYDREGALLREIQIMAASGWRLHQRWPGGADFASGSADSGVSTGVHLILLVLTLGLWLPVMILVELASPSRITYCRLTFDDRGEPRYQSIGRPGKSQQGKGR
jgi:hypothetical protein